MDLILNNNNDKIVISFTLRGGRVKGEKGGMLGYESSYNVWNFTVCFSVLIQGVGRPSLTVNEGLKKILEH